MLDTHIILSEQQDTEVYLLSEEISFLRDKLKFQIGYAAMDVSTDGASRVSVNPKQYVGHAMLSTARTVIVKPKIPAINVFRMLAFVYGIEDRNLFQNAEVLYEQDSLLFEPLVVLFNSLVEQRGRRGLAQDYIENAENLALLRGRIDFREHVNRNTGRADRLFCRFHERTVDINHNRVIKTAMRELLLSGMWTANTMHYIRRNLGVFLEVGFYHGERGAFPSMAYTRMTEDYRILHALSRMFLEHEAISELPGQVRFSGFTIDMNVLFERFLSQAFIKAASPSVSISLQDEGYLSSRPNYSVRIVPDILIQNGVATSAVIDAKYKRTPFDNHDVYQMLAYTTAYCCDDAFLFYPTIELGADDSVHVLNTSKIIYRRGVDLSKKTLVEDTVEIVRRTIDSYSWRKQSASAATQPTS